MADKPTLPADAIYAAADDLESRGIDASANPDLVEALAVYNQLHEMRDNGKL